MDVNVLSKNTGDNRVEAETDGGRLPWKKAAAAVRGCTFDPRTQPQTSHILLSKA